MKRSFQLLFVLAWALPLAGWTEGRLGADHLGTDFERSIIEQSGQWAINAEAISHWSGYWLVDPLAVTASLDVGIGQGWWSVGEFDSRRLRQFIAQLANSDHALAITTADLAGRPASTEALAAWEQRYRQLRSPVAAANAQTTPLESMNIPIDFNRDWYFNGTHTWTGADNGEPMSSIDLLRDRDHQWGDDTSNIWVTAAHDGVLTRFSRCFARITHPSGWFTDYYHLNNIQFESGQSVKAGAAIANYANDLFTAICDGGHSNLPHVHFAVGRDRERVAIDQLRYSGYAINSGRYSYDPDPQYMWLEKGGERLTAWVDTIRHRSGQPIDFAYNGMWYEPELAGHGINLVTMPTVTGDANVFLVLFTYDDTGAANFYSGNAIVSSWQLGEELEIALFQSAGGGFSAMRSVDFESSDQYWEAGLIRLRLDDCQTGLANLQLNERSTGALVSQQWNLSKLIGTPIEVCQG